MNERQGRVVIDLLFCIAAVALTADAGNDGLRNMLMMLAVVFFALADLSGLIEVVDRLRK